MNRVFTVQVANTRLVKHYTLSASSEDQARIKAYARFEKETHKEVTGLWINFAQDPGSAESDNFSLILAPEDEINE